MQRKAKKPSEVSKECFSWPLAFATTPPRQQLQTPFQHPRNNKQHVKCDHNHLQYNESTI